MELEERSRSTEEGRRLDAKDGYGRRWAGDAHF
jgi:hypothetical protein